MEDNYTSHEPWMVRRYVISGEPDEIVWCETERALIAEAMEDYIVCGCATEILEVNYRPRRVGDASEACDKWRDHLGAW